MQSTFCQSPIFVSNTDSHDAAEPSHRIGVLNWLVCARWQSRDQRERLRSEAMILVIYLITFAGYGCRLHGDESGSVDREHNLPGNRLVEADPKRALAERQLMDQPPFCMDRSRRETVLAALQERSSQRGWNLLAAHVRTNHVHIVIEAEARPERVMRWARHGSTRWLWKPVSVSAAIRYVVDEQGDPMAVFETAEL